MDLPVRRRSLAEVTAGHVREGLKSGRWIGKLPGVGRLATQCEVSRQTLRRALHLLEREGVITSGGNGRSRRTAIDPGGSQRGLLRIGILLRERLEDDDRDQQMLISAVQRALEAAGHDYHLARRSQKELGDNVLRIQRHLGEIAADGWVIVSGTRGLLEWGATHPTPILALGGDGESLRIASSGADLAPAYAAAVRHLVSLGHRRIVLLTPRHFRHPVEAAFIVDYKAALIGQGIDVSAYHVPDWEETPDGLTKLLDSIFRMTPPTAILLLKSQWTSGVMAFLAGRRLKVPDDVSLICRHGEPALAWHRPALARFSCNQELIVRRILRWVGSAALGRPDRRKSLVPLKFIPAGSTGPAKSDGSAPHASHRPDHTRG